jgi:hypothetical protein
VSAALAPAKVFVATALALAIMIWIGPLSSEARQAATDSVTPISPTTSVPCLNKKGTKYRPRFEPARCAHFGHGGAFAGGVNLRGLEWQNWGDSTAISTAGTECGFHLPCADIPVTVQAFRIRKACGRRMYTRLKAISEFGKTLVKTRACLGPA